MNDNRRSPARGGAPKSAGGRDTRHGNTRQAHGPYTVPPDCSCGGHPFVERRSGNVVHVAVAHAFDCEPFGTFGGDA